MLPLAWDSSSSKVQNWPASKLTGYQAKQGAIELKPNWPVNSVSLRLKLDLDES